MKAPWPFGHFGLKLLSVGLAILLWIVVSGDETVERLLRVPLELQQVPAGLELMGEIPANVDVRVRGASGTLSHVAAGDIVAVLDLHTARAGQRLFPITPDQVRTPFGVEVVQVTPSPIGMEFERSLTRQLPIVPAVDGRPAPEFVVGDRRAEPRMVEVVGPETAVRHATEVVTEPVSVADAKEAVERDNVILGVVDPSIRLKDTRVAKVTVQIVRAPLERTFHNQPVHLRSVGPALDAQALPAVVDITMRGSQKAHIVADDLVAFIDLGGLGAGQYSLDVRVDAPADVSVTRVEPPSVQVRISRVKHE